MANEEKFFVNNTWLTWDEVHRLGYTRDSTAEVHVYDNVGRKTILMMDMSDHTIYDSVNRVWLNDIDTLDVYFTHYDKTMYLCNEPITIDIYSKSLYADTPSYTIYSGSMQSIDILYSAYGITESPCEPYLRVDGELLSWYDTQNGLYWDNRESKRSWSDTPPSLDADEGPDIIKSKINHELLRLNLSAVEVIPKHDISLLLSSLTRTYTDNVYVTSTSGSDIGGTHYNYGDSIPISIYAHSDNLSVVKHYQSELLFNDTLIHDQSSFDSMCDTYSLSTEHPYNITIGQTKVLPSMYTSMPNSSWFWFGGFNSGNDITSSSGNWWNSTSYAQNPFPSLDSDYINITSSGKYTHGRASNGTSVVNLSAVRIASYNGSIEVYAKSNTTITRSSTANNNTIIVKCNSSILSNTWPLPSDLFTLDGRDITWNSNSMYYNIFYGMTL